jgi:hypothetical protein
MRLDFFQDQQKGPITRAEANSIRKAINRVAKL